QYPVFGRRARRRWRANWWCPGRRRERPSSWQKGLRLFGFRGDHTLKSVSDRPESQEGSVGLLDDLKKQADALKAQDTDRTESLRANAVAVDLALRRNFLYLNDLGKQLNVVQMPCPFTYRIPTVPDINGL